MTTERKRDTIDAAQLARIAAGMGADPAEFVQALRFAHPMTHDNERTAVMSLSACALLALDELYPEAE